MASCAWVNFIILSLINANRVWLATNPMTPETPLGLISQSAPWEYKAPIDWSLVLLPANQRPAFRCIFDIMTDGPVTADEMIVINV